MLTTPCSPRLPIALACAGALLSFACASTKAEPESPTSSMQGTVRLADSSQPNGMAEGTRYITTLGLPSDMLIHYPDWIVNPAIDNVLGSVGVAGPSVLGTRNQVEEARFAARMELARMLETRVQSVGRGELEEHSRATGDPEEPTPNAEGRRSELGVDRDITDLVLSGSRQRAMWFDPLSRDCYVWVVMDGGIPGKANHFVENGTSVYVANQPIGTEYRPERQPEPRSSEPVAPAAPPVIKSPIEQLEENLKPIETLPVPDKR
jgi:hypothetical protein